MTRFHRYESKQPKAKIVMNDKLLPRIDAVLLEPTLNTSSKDFLTSLREFHTHSGGLTEKQIVAFEKIESAFSPQSKEKVAAWVVNFTTKMKEDLLVVSKYYMTTHYFKDIAAKVVEDPTFVPTQRQYETVMNNKYAQTVLDAHNSAPKFAVKALVYITESASHAVPVGLRGKAAFVVEVNSSPITNACKGAKKYRILPFGTTKTLEIEERLLKGSKRVKKEHTKDESKDSV